MLASQKSHLACKSLLSPPLPPFQIPTRIYVGLAPCTVNNGDLAPSEDVCGSLYPFPISCLSVIMFVDAVSVGLLTVDPVSVSCARTCVHDTWYFFVLVTTLPATGWTVSFEPRFIIFLLCRHSNSWYTQAGRCSGTRSHTSPTMIPAAILGRILSSRLWCVQRQSAQAIPYLLLTRATDAATAVGRRRTPLPQQ